MNRMAFSRKARSLGVAVIIMGGFLLFISNLSASTLGWSPLTMSFPDVPYNTTATQTLTLTNTGSGLLLVSNVDWEYMTYYFPPGDESPPAFRFNTGILPAGLLPGESMDIDISFSPIDDGIISIANAQLLITNDSDNASSLHYWMDGLGITGVPTGPVDLSGTIKTDNGTDICAMVLASGKYMFSCNPPGIFSLNSLPREQNSTVKRQIYADGFFPKVDSLAGTTDEAVVMTRSGACPNYNAVSSPAYRPDSAAKRIDISGKVLLQNSQTPICAMALANGQYMFTCDGTGSYALNIPLDNNGQFKLQVYADGFAPITQKFDEFSPANDVHMARATECQ